MAKTAFYKLGENSTLFFDSKTGVKILKGQAVKIQSSQSLISKKITEAMRSGFLVECPASEAEEMNAKLEELNDKHNATTAEVYRKKAEAKAIIDPLNPVVAPPKGDDEETEDEGEEEEEEEDEDRDELDGKTIEELLDYAENDLEVTPEALAALKKLKKSDLLAQVKDLRDEE